MYPIPEFVYMNSTAWLISDNTRVEKPRFTCLLSIGKRTVSYFSTFSLFCWIQGSYLYTTHTHGSWISPSHFFLFSATLNHCHTTPFDSSFFTFLSQLLLQQKPIQLLGIKLCYLVSLPKPSNDLCSTTRQCSQYWFFGGMNISNILSFLQCSG